MRTPHPSRRLVAAVAAGLAVSLAVVAAWPMLAALATTYVGTANSTNYLEFRNSTSDGWNPLKTPDHWVSTTKNPSSGKVAYCLEHRKDYPDGNQSFSAFNPDALYNQRTQDGLKAILQKGYPAAMSITYGVGHTVDLNSDEARYATANALRAYVYERGGGGYKFMDLRGYDPAKPSTWKYVRNRTSAGRDVMVYTLLLLDAARAADVLVPSVSASKPAMTLQGGVYTGRTTVAVSECNGGYKIASKPAWLSIVGYTGKSGDVLTLSAPRGYAGRPVHLVLTGYDNRTSANIFWYAPSRGDYQHFVVADYSVTNAATTGLLDFSMPTGTARILKVDANSGVPLAGAQFRIYQGLADGSTVLIDSPVSGDDGYATTTLPPGTYSVYEIVPPSGYNIDPTPQNITITDGGTTEITMADTPADGRVFIHKVGSADSAITSIFATATPPPGWDDGGGAVMLAPRPGVQRVLEAAQGSLPSHPTTDTAQAATRRIAALSASRLASFAAPVGGASPSGLVAQAETDLPGATFQILRYDTASFHAELSPFEIFASGGVPDTTTFYTSLNSSNPDDHVEVVGVEPEGAGQVVGNQVIGLLPGLNFIHFRVVSAGQEVGGWTGSSNMMLPFRVWPFPWYPVEPGTVSVHAPWNLPSGDVDYSSVASVLATSTTEQGPDCVWYGRELYVPGDGTTVTVEATWTAGDASFDSWNDGTTETVREVRASDLPLSFTLTQPSYDASGSVDGTQTGTVDVPASTSFRSLRNRPEDIFASNERWTVIETLTTGPDGTVMSEQHAPGTYYLREIAAPPGYELDPTLHEFYLPAGDTAQFKIADRPRRGAVHRRQDRRGDRRRCSPVPSSTSTTTTGSLVTTLTTGLDGSAARPNSSPATTRLAETKAPVGWALNDRVATFTIDPLSDSPTVTIDVRRRAA